MCSMKCEMPLSFGPSSREPVPIQIPTETLRTCGMYSVMTRTPFGRAARWISRTVCGRRDMYTFYRGPQQGPSARMSVVGQALVGMELVDLQAALGQAEPSFRGRQIYDAIRSEEHTSELQSRLHLVCRPLLE